MPLERHILVKTVMWFWQRVDSYLPGCSGLQENEFPALSHQSSRRERRLGVATDEFHGYTSPRQKDVFGQLGQEANIFRIQIRF